LSERHTSSTGPALLVHETGQRLTRPPAMIGRRTGIGQQRPQPVTGAGWERLSATIATTSPTTPTNRVYPRSSNGEPVIYEGDYSYGTMSRMADRITVSFSDLSSASGPLTWGQQQLWRAMVEMDSSLGIGGVVPLQPGDTPEDKAEELAFFLHRYQALRTRLSFGPDGEVTQVVAASGESWVDVHDAEGDPQAEADALFAQWRAKKYDYENEFPMRLAVVRKNGVATHVVAMLCHIAADAVGVGVMLRELHERDPETGEAKAPHTGRQPVELARWQQSPAAKRHTDSAMRFWESHLRTIPAARFQKSAALTSQAGSGRYQQICWRSRALLLAMQAISLRDRMDAGPVLLAAAAVGLARLTGANPYVAQTIVNNRFRPGLSDMVSPLNQNGLCVIDLAGVTLAEAIDRARKASINSAKFAYYEPRAREELIARVNAERGETLDLANFINDRRFMAADSTPAQPPTQAQIVAAQADTVLLWENELPMFNEKLMLNFDEIDGALQITAETDTHYVTLDGLKDLMSKMEEVAVEAAADPAGSTKISQL
jgi:hypothetical protein